MTFTEDIKFFIDCLYDRNWTPEQLSRGMHALSIRFSKESGLDPALFNMALTQYDIMMPKRIQIDIAGEKHE